MRPIRGVAALAALTFAISSAAKSQTSSHPQTTDPLTAEEAAPPPPAADQIGAEKDLPEGPSPAAAVEAAELAEPDGGLDTLRTAEIAIAAALALLVVGSLTRAYAGRKV